MFVIYDLQYNNYVFSYEAQEDIAPKMWMWADSS